MDPLPDDRMWAEILARVRGDSPGLFAPWFGQLRAVGLSAGVMRIAGPDLPRTEWLARYAAGPFTAAAQAVTGNLIAVEFVVGNAPPEPFPPVLGEEEEHARRLERLLATPANLAAEYTFENFVVGPTNRFAHAACVAVAAAPGRSYNPLFIHGNVGLGKTHLLQAVAHQLLTGDPAARVLYLSCETLVNDFIDAIERNRLTEFRNMLRGAGCLIVDDVQFLTEGDRTQEEFFHTFNTLHQSGRQIILSADVGPEKIKGLEDRLVSRFKSGLVTQIDPPAFETRVAILKKKARLRNLEIPDDVARLVADAVAANTRALEGALTSLQHAAMLEGRPIDEALARAAMRDLLPGPAGPPPAPRELTLGHIMEAACRHFGVRFAELTGKRRTRSIAQARMVAMYLARKLTRLSLEEIGGQFGGRDHSTVLHAEKTIEADRSTDPAVEGAVRRIVADLGVTA